MRGGIKGDLMRRKRKKELERKRKEEMRKEEI